MYSMYCIKYTTLRRKGRNRADTNKARRASNCEAHTAPEAFHFLTIHCNHSQLRAYEHSVTTTSILTYYLPPFLARIITFLVDIFHGVSI